MRQKIPDAARNPKPWNLTLCIKLY